MKKQNELSKPNEAGAKRKVKRSQLGEQKQVGAAGKKAAPAVRKNTALWERHHTGRPTGRQHAPRRYAALMEKNSRKGYGCAAGEKRAQAAEVRKS